MLCHYESREGTSDFRLIKHDLKVKTRGFTLHEIIPFTTEFCIQKVKNFFKSVNVHRYVSVSEKSLILNGFSHTTT